MSIQPVAPIDIGQVGEVRATVARTAAGPDCEYTAWLAQHPDANAPSVSFVDPASANVTQVVVPAGGAYLAAQAEWTVGFPVPASYKALNRPGLHVTVWGRDADYLGAPWLPFNPTTLNECVTTAAPPTPVCVVPSSEITIAAKWGDPPDWRTAFGYYGRLMPLSVNVYPAGPGLLQWEGGAGTPLSQLHKIRERNNPAQQDVDTCKDLAIQHGVHGGASGIDPDCFVSAGASTGTWKVNRHGVSADTTNVYGIGTVDLIGRSELCVEHIINKLLVDKGIPSCHFYVYQRMEIDCNKGAADQWVQYKDNVLYYAILHDEIWVARDNNLQCRPWPLDPNATECW